MKKTSTLENIYSHSYLDSSLMLVKTTKPIVKTVTEEEDVVMPCNGLPTIVKKLFASLKRDLTMNPSADFKPLSINFAPLSKEFA